MRILLCLNLNIFYLILFFPGNSMWSLLEKDVCAGSCICSVNFHFFLENQVVRCCLEHAASVARTFLTSDAVVVDIKKPESIAAGNPMDNSGFV